MVRIMENQMEKKMENEMETGVILGIQYLVWGYYGTHYRVRLYPPFGYSISYKDYNLTGFNHQKKRYSPCPSNPKDDCCSEFPK